MTLNGAWDAYQADPTLTNLIQLLITAREYYADEAIEIGSFNEVLDVVQARLEMLAT